MNVLFVCSGNIHRSPLAAAILGHRLRGDGRTDVATGSAGTIALDGMSAAPEAAALALADGIDLSDHRARRLRRHHLSDADWIVAMEAEHLPAIELLDRSSASRSLLLGQHADAGCGIEPGSDIPDAFSGDHVSFRRSYSIIQACVARLYREIPAAPQEIYAGAVEEAFRRRTGGALALAPADWHQIDQWWRRDVPLWIVLEALRETKGRTAGRGDGRRMRRLAYAAPSVEERFAAWLRGGDGGQTPPPAPDEPAPPLLAEATVRVRRAAAQASRLGRSAIASLLQEAAGEIAAIPESLGDDAQRLKLDLLEERITASLRRAAGDDSVRSLVERAARDLASHRSRMAEEAFERTVGRLVDQWLREAMGIPRLSV